MCLVYSFSFRWLNSNAFNLTVREFNLLYLCKMRIAWKFNANPLFFVKIFENSQVLRYSTIHIVCKYMLKPRVETVHFMFLLIYIWFFFTTWDHHMSSIHLAPFFELSAFYLLHSINGNEFTLLSLWNGNVEEKSETNSKTKKKLIKKEISPNGQKKLVFAL